MDQNAIENNDSRRMLLDLPNELLSLVLEYATLELPRHIHHSPPTIDKQHRNGRNTALGLLRLCEVCRRFRALLLSMPAPWAAVAFYLPEPSRGVALARSKDAPLSMHIHNTIDVLPREAPRRVPRMTSDPRAELALEHVARMRALVGYDLTPWQAGTLFAAQLPQLEGIELCYSAFVLLLDVPRQVCIDAPNLRRFRLEIDKGMPIQFLDHVGPELTLKLPALCSLNILLKDLGLSASLVLRWLRSVFETSPLIEDLTLAFNKMRNQIPWNQIFSTHSVQLNHLRALTLTEYPDTNLDVLYNYICPSRPDWYSVSFSPERIRIARRKDAAVTALCDAIEFLLRRPTYDRLHVKVTDDSGSLSVQVGLFRAFEDPRLYFSTYPQRVSESALVSLELSDDIRQDEPFVWCVLDALIAPLEDNKFKQIFVHAPSVEATSYLLRSIVRLCTSVTDLVITHDASTYGFGFPIIIAPGILPALETIFIQAGSFTSNDYALHWWTDTINWLQRCAEKGVFIRRLRILGRRYQSEEGVRRRNVGEEMCERAAAFVQEVVDERVVEIPNV